MTPAAGPVVVGNVAGVPTQRKIERIFYSGMSLVILLSVVAGFGPTFFFRSLTDAPPLPPVVFLHGVVMTAWVLLLVVQTWLVASGRKAVHKRIGVAGLALAAVMIPVGYITAVEAVRRGFDPVGTGSPLTFLTQPLGDLAIFGSFVALAVVFRHRPELHKRLMLLATAGALLPPALGRLPGPRPLLAFVLYAILLAAGPVFDWITRRRIHPIYWAAPLLFLSVPARRLIGATDAWHEFARWLIGG